MTGYSPSRRTALVLTGTGAHGAYHAGVLRALQEAGVKIDVIAGQGVGAAGAALAAIDGSAQLWDASGIWRGAAAARVYGWRRPVRVAAWLAAAGAALLVAILVGGAVVPMGVVRSAILIWAMAAVALIAWLVAVDRRGPARRRASGAWWWRI